MNKDIETIKEVLEDKDTKLWIGQNGIKAMENIISEYFNLKEKYSRQIIETQKEREKINEIENVLNYLYIIPSRDKFGDYRPIKNTSTQRCYRAIVAIKEILDK